jgi:NRPS condensation-like uncharacterized protein
MNKDTTFEEFRASVITPTQVEEAFENLPARFIKECQSVFEELVERKYFTKVYSSKYIGDVAKRGDVFNQEVMDVLVFVGLRHKATKKFYGITSKEKIPSTN